MNSNALTKIGKGMYDSADFEDVGEYKVSLTKMTELSKFDLRLGRIGVGMIGHTASAFFILVVVDAGVAFVFAVVAAAVASTTIV